MIDVVVRKWRYVRYIYRSRNAWDVAVEIAKRCVAPIYLKQEQEIFLCDVDSVGAPPGPESTAVEGTMIDHLVVTAPEKLDDLASEIPASMAPHLSRRFSHGRIAVLTRITTPEWLDGRAIAYCICERGVFSALQRRRQISPAVLFSHYVYVDPAYRGRRIFERLRSATAQYGRTLGIRWICSVVSTTNRASLRARRRTGDYRIGVVRRRRWLGGLLVFETPWEEVDAAFAGALEGS